ncbi:MAG: two-component regulator propeller domain-containing protein [Flavobacteriaceae bacterium]
MKVVFPFLILILLLASNNALFGQIYKMTRYADDSGLPSRIVRDVIQSEDGFIWVAGNNGLYKFDGKTFKPYLASLKDTVGLRDNKINAVLQASDKRIWIGTPKGLHVLEHDSIHYVRMVDNATDNQEHVLNIFEDKDDNLWVGTYGGLFLIEKSKEVIHFLSEGGDLSIAEGVVWGVNQDNKGRIWVAGSDGPYLLEEKTSFSFKKLKLELAAKGDNKERNFFAYQQYNDSIFFVPSSSGLFKGSIINDSILRLNSFSDGRTDVASQIFVEHLAIGRDKSVWLGTFKNGFKKFKYFRGQLHEQDIIIKNGYLGLSGTTNSVYEDSQGNIWLSNTNGLYKLSLDQGNIVTFPPRFQERCAEKFYGIYAMVEDRAGHIWFTTPSELYRVKKSDILEGKCPEDYLVFENKNMQLSRNLMIDSQYRLWVGADNGLFVTQLNKDHEPDTFRRYTTTNGLPHNWSFDIHEIDANNFWVGNYAGLLKMTLNNNNLETVEFKIYEANEERSTALINSQANEIEEDHLGNTWIGTFSGLSRLTREEGPGEFESYTSAYNNFEGLSNNSIKKIFRDSKNRLWIATQRGLNLYNQKENKFLQFGIAQGLPSEYILGIQEDSKGFLWIGTTNGLIKTIYDPVSKTLTQIEHFTSRHGLADNIPYRNSILIDKEDHVIIGSREGISVIEGGSTTFKEHNIRLALTDIETTRKKLSGFSSIKAQMKEGDEIVLSHQENSVKISYAALDFSDLSRNAYRHKIIPVSDQWIVTGNTSDLSYYNLAPGNYEFVLDGGNGLGQWSANPIHLKLTINPPFWQSRLAILIYVLLGGLILWVFYRWRLARTLQRLEQASRLEKALVMEREQLRQENAADFHDELGSKVTKISLYLTLAERSLEEEGDPLPWFAKIRDNIKGLSGGFRDLLWVIDPKKDSLGDTFLRLKDFGEDLFSSQKVNFKTTGLHLAVKEILLNPQTKKQVILIFKEAMTNCLKYSEAEEIELALKSEGEFFSITLQDNGKGFNVDLKSKGRGLKNMKARSKKINADLTIRSSEKGTEVHLSRIPHTSDRFQLQDS